MCGCVGWGGVGWNARQVRCPLGDLADDRLMIQLYHAFGDDIPEPETGSATQMTMLGLVRRIDARRSALDEDGARL